MFTIPSSAVIRKCIVQMGSHLEGSMSVEMEGLNTPELEEVEMAHASGEVENIESE